MIYVLVAGHVWMFESCKKILRLDPQSGKSDVAFSSYIAHQSYFPGSGSGSAEWEKRVMEWEVPSVCLARTRRRVQGGSRGLDYSSPGTG